MKIEVKERSDSNYYDEVLYVMSYYDKLLKSPNKKVYGLSKSVVVYGVISAVMIVLMAIMYFINNSSIAMYSIIFFSLLLVLSIVLYALVKGKIKKIQKIEETVIFNMDEEGIKTIRSESTIEVKWENIKNIKINKYSISFIPTSRNDALISMNIKYKDEILEELKKLNKESLIV